MFQGIMRLMEEAKKETNQKSVPNGTNGNGVHTSNGDASDSESDIEEAEPVSATLVLRVVSEPPSPALSRKSSFRRDQPPAFLNEENRGETLLQVITIFCGLFSDFSSPRFKFKDQLRAVPSQAQENSPAHARQVQHHHSMLQIQKDMIASKKKDRKDNHNSHPGTQAGSLQLVLLHPCMGCLRLISIDLSMQYLSILHTQATIKSISKEI